MFAEGSDSDSAPLLLRTERRTSFACHRVSLQHSAPATQLSQETPKPARPRLFCRRRAEARELRRRTLAPPATARTPSTGSARARTTRRDHAVVPDPARSAHSQPSQSISPREPVLRHERERQGWFPRPWVPRKPRLLSPRCKCWRPSKADVLTRPHPTRGEVRCAKRGVRIDRTLTRRGGLLEVTLGLLVRDVITTGAGRPR